MHDYNPQRRVSHWGHLITVSHDCFLVIVRPHGVDQLLRTNLRDNVATTRRDMTECSKERA